MRKIDVAGVNHLRLTVADLQGTKLTVAAKALIKERLLLFYQPGLQQQRTHFSRRLKPGDTPRLAQHGGLIRGTQVG